MSIIIPAYCPGTIEQAYLIRFIYKSLLKTFLQLFLRKEGSMYRKWALKRCDYMKKIGDSKDRD